MCFPALMGWFHWGSSTSSSNELYDYIYGVLETGDHGPYRQISFDLAMLNDAIQQHAERIGNFWPLVTYSDT